MTDGEGREVLRLDGLTRRFGTVVAVDRVSLALTRGELLTLLGPSGCGKTTVLRLIGGFERPDEGRVTFAGRDVTASKPQERGFGMVFQSYALFPHLNVFENVAFGLRARSLDPATIRDRVAAALTRVELTGLAERSVQALSGGQQQRVALARAIATEPPLLLLDEPLSNLDQTLRAKTRVELRALVRRLGITAIFVTHDQEEAYDLSDRIAVMRAGKIVQVGAPRTLYEDPVDPFVAGFVGRANALAAVREGSGARVAPGVVWALGREVLDGPREGETGSLVFRPESLRFLSEAEGPGTGSFLPGVVRDRRFRGGSSLYLVEVDARPTGAKSPERGATLEVVGEADGPAPGSRVRVAPRPGARLLLFRVSDA
jgi:putative spermidine/putrescine transport system ATP-binding protein